MPAHNEKMRAKASDIAGQVDVLVANLEDAIPADSKEIARAGAIEVGRKVDFSKTNTGYWCRINALNAPWHLDDVTELVANIGNQLDVIMVPKVEGPWDIHYMDQMLALLEAKHGVKRPIMLHAILETAQGVANVEAIALFTGVPAGEMDAKGNYPKGTVYARVMARLAERFAALPAVLADTHFCMELGRYLEKADDVAGAVDAYHRSRQLFDAVLRDETRKAMLEAQARFEDQQRQREIEAALDLTKGDMAAAEEAEVSEAA